MISSTDGAAEYWGGSLGQFTSYAFNGHPVYKQSDTEGDVDYYLYHISDYWRINAPSKNQNALRNSKNSSVSPQSGWEYWAGEEWRCDDSSLTLRSGVVEPCPVVRVEAHGEAVQASRVQHVLGEYVPTDKWLSGLPVYQDRGGSLKYLRVAEGSTAWGIGPATNGGLWIDSGRGTTSPGDRMAGGSERSGYSNWRYSDGVEWKEGNITLSC